MLAEAWKYIAGKSGLEIGGPSTIFNDQLPFYSGLEALDGINFSNETIWESKIKEGPGGYLFHPSRYPGHQYVGEAQDLPMSDESYDFVLSSHCLEHSANPLKVLGETKRVLKRDGVCLYILPAKKFTFDHRREVTKMSHLIDDYERGTLESDMTHLDEILSLHDLSRDPPAGNLKQFTERCLKNPGSRGMHQHVFDEALMGECFKYIGMKVLLYEFMLPYHQIMLAQKA